MATMLFNIGTSQKKIFPRAFLLNSTIESDFGPFADFFSQLFTIKLYLKLLIVFSVAFMIMMNVNKNETKKKVSIYEFLMRSVSMSHHYPRSLTGSMTD